MTHEMILVPATT